MKRSYNEIYIHIVWSTKNREPMLNEKIEDEIYKIIVEKAKKHKCKIIAIGNWLDHIHVLTKISITTVIADLIKDLKGNTSYFINQKMNQNLYWQDGYGAISVSLKALDKVKEYVLHQKTKHSNMDLTDELELE